MKNSKTIISITATLLVFSLCLNVFMVVSTTNTNKRIKQVTVEYQQQVDSIEQTMQNYKDTIDMLNLQLNNEKSVIKSEINDNVPFEELYCYHCGYELQYIEDFIECPECLTKLNYITDQDNEVINHYFDHREN